MALSLEQQAIEAISRSRHLLITARSVLSIDDLCGAIALGLWLKQLNKSFDIVIPDAQPQSYPSFLPPDVTVDSQLGSLRTLKITLNVQNTPLSELSYDVRDGALDITVVPKHGAWRPQDVGFSSGDMRYDLVITIGTPDRHSLAPLFGSELNILHELTTINIDASASNERWATVNLVNPTRSSSCESLFTLFEAWNPQLMSADIATAVLAGMISATKGFRTPHLSGKTLERSSTLLERGARRQEIVQHLWRTRSITDLQLWGRALSRVEQHVEKGLVWTFITETDFLELKSSPHALEGILHDLLTYTPGTKAILLFQQQGDHWIVDLHAHAPYSALELGKSFLPKGNQEQVRFQTTMGLGGLTEQKQLITNAILDELRS